MAPRSSKIASAVKKTNTELGTRLRTSVKHPSAKAMSVAMGMPQPAWPGPPELNNR